MIRVHRVGMALFLSIILVALVSVTHAVFQKAVAQHGGSPVYAGPPMQVKERGLYTGQRRPQNTMPQPANGERENVLIILDSSSSMAEALQGNETKMAAAKRTIAQILQKFPDNTPVGLRVYGQHAWNACHSTDLLVPIAPGGRYAIGKALLNIEPAGATPISYTIQKALMEDFRGLSGRKNIVLVSDGEETCSYDPCGVTVAMLRQGVDVKINVVGYGLQNLEAEKQLRCVALATKGKYYTADTAAQLADSLEEALRVNKNVQAQVVTGSSEEMEPRLLKKMNP